jgi:hypothetical protein
MKYLGRIFINLFKNNLKRNYLYLVYMEESKEDRRKRLARERAKRNYEQNKDSILAYKKEKYSYIKIPKEEQQKRGRKPIEKEFGITTINKKTRFTEEEIINLIMNDDEINSVETKKFHSNNIRRFFRIAECEDLRCLKIDYKLASKRVEDGLNQFTGEPLSPQSIQHTFASILFVISNYATELLNPKIKDYLQDKFNEYSLRTNDYYDTKRNELVYPSFKNYIKKVKEKYGTDSKEYLVANLYNEFTIRDDYGNAPILDNPMSSNEINYFVMRKQYIYFINNDYKTSNKYNSIKYTFSTTLTRLIKNYMANNNINLGDFLFNGNLSNFVSNMNKQLGYDNLGGINIFRHMRVSEMDGETYEDKIKLAKQMGHSAMTIPKYRNKIELKV